MKKLITIMAAAASALLAFGALGDVSAPPAGFEGSASGSVFDPSVTESESTYWYAATVDDTNIITNYAESGTSVPSLPTNVVRPDGMKENDAYPSNSNFLSLETSTPLFRSVQANSQDGTFTGSTIGDGIYLDTLVKFTASEEEFKDGALEADVDKIAIEYVEHGEESLDTNDPTDTPFTNFVIRAGYIGTSAISQKNYRAYLLDDPTLENFDKDAWHRLTVRAIADIGGNNVGFIVYLDQKPLAYDGACGDDFSPSTDAQNYYNNEIHAVYPSAVGSGTGKNTIAAVAFSGNGAIDDVVFTTETPEFITASESVVVPFVADAGVKAISVLPDGATDAIPVDMTADTLVAVLPAQTIDFTVTATVNTAEGYEFVSIKVGETTYNTTPASVTDYAGDTIMIATQRNNFTYIDENDAEQSAGTLTAALAGVKEGGTIKLNYVYNLADYEGLPEQGTSVFTITKSCVLDLNGKTLNGGSSDDFYLFTPEMDCEFTVIDSATGGKIIYGGTKGIFNGNIGDVFIGSITLTDNGPTFDGSLIGAEGYVSQIWRGKFSATENTEKDAFVGEFAFGDATKCAAELDAGGTYWVVTYTSGEEPVEDIVIAVPTAAKTLVYDGTEQTGVEAGTGYTLTGATATNAGDYTATATLETGYVWEGGSKEPQTINWSIAADTTAEVTVTLAETEAEYSAQLQFPAATATIGGNAVQGTTQWDAEIAEPVAGGTNTYTVTFTVSDNNYAGSTGTATFKVWKAESEEPVYPSYIDNITDPEKKAAYEAKYSTWATTYSVADGAGNEEAFLLNCAPANVETAKANFKIPSITVDAQGNVTVGTIEGTFNGKLQLKGSTDLSTWTNLNAASKDYNFFKYELTY